MTVERQRCRYCDGSGKRDGVECIECHGWGTIKPDRYSKPTAYQPERFRREARRPRRRRPTRPPNED